MITLLVFTLLTLLILFSNGNPTEKDNEQPLVSRKYKGRYYDASEPGFIISSPDILNNVKWANWKYCERGTYVSAFQLKVHKDGGHSWGVTGLKLYCVRLNSDRIDEENVLTTSKSKLGKWGSVFKCQDGLFTGFNGRLEVNQLPPRLVSRYFHSKGITNLRMICSNAKTGTLEGDGISDGKYYTEDQICGKRMGICGMRVQVDTVVGEYERSRGITHMEMKCCKIPDPASTCEAVSKYESIQECRNGGLTDLTCKYSYIQGVSDLTSNKNTISHSKMSSVGFTLTASMPTLFLNFDSTFTATKNTDQAWGQQSSSTWSKQKTVWAEVKVPPGENLVIEQVTGTCGDFRIGSPKIRVKPTSGKK